MNGTAMLKCDLCSDPHPIARYHTRSFGITTNEDVFPDTPIHLIDDVPYVATDDIHPVRGTGHLVDPDWLACEPCANLIDQQNLDGLIAHCLANFRISHPLPPDMTEADLADFCRYWYTAFFQNLLSTRLPL